VGRRRDLEAAIVKHEVEQHGLVAVRQARALRISEGALQRRVDRERHRRIARGVLVNPSVPDSFAQRVLAAVLSAGPTAFASHETAARLWELPLPGPATLEVTTDLKRRPRPAGVRMHRTGTCHEDDTTTRNGIAVASVPLTIVQLSGRLDVRWLGRITDEAVRAKLTTLEAVQEVSLRLGRAPGRSPRKIALMLGRRVPGTADRESVLEDYVFDALRRFDVPLPVAQLAVHVAGKERRIDLGYASESLALEAKGFDVYRMRKKFDEFTVRGNELKLAGWRVLEFTSAFTDWTIAAQVAEALGCPIPPRPLRALTFAEWKRLR
jgi:hypothetical protein